MDDALKMRHMSFVAVPGGGHPVSTFCGFPLHSSSSSDSITT